jgi:hypothetical protein
LRGPVQQSVASGFFPGTAGRDWWIRAWLASS